jgi:nitroreductase
MKGRVKFMNRSDVQSALEWRYAAKKFDPSKIISSEDWRVLEESLRLSPSSYGLQPWRFFVVQNPQIRQQLKVASWNQSQVTDASHYVVIAFQESVGEADIRKFMETTAMIRGVDVGSLERYRKVIEGDLLTGTRSKEISTWSQRQTYIAMGFVMLAAALLKIDSCPMEGIEADEYDRILGLKGTGFKTVAGVALGYRHAEDKYALSKKVRYPASEIIRYL